jgi:Spy/CpxP family protein refolding chaperone
MTGSLTRRLIKVLLTATLVAGAAAWPYAQRGGRGGGAPGGEFGGFQLSRLETLTNEFALTKDQKKAVKALLDDAHKSAAPTRDALASSHAAIGAAIAANKGQAEVDAAVKQYGQHAAAMAALEMKVLAQLLVQLEPEQRTNGVAVRSAFFLMRGAFLDAKKWDAVPDSRSY